MKRHSWVKSGFLLLAVFVMAVVHFDGSAQQASGREVAFPVTLEWAKQKSATKYRLQIAADEKFENIYLDRRVSGNRYTVEDLSSGYYYWRVAAGDSRAGNFSRPTKFFISGGVVTPVILPNHSAAPAPAVRPRSH
ncbi:MAG TPA: hypothetical protein VLL54_05125 [Pyrinomonadaceae bacterium]|nr:hypothetical protein [Pyrinomonadaceae bacterium]